MSTASQEWQEEVVDLRLLLTRLFAKRAWILGAGLIGAAAFAIAAFLIPPVYLASAVLVPADTNSNSGLLDSALGEIGGLASLAGIDVKSNDKAVDEALAVLKSRTFNEKFIAERQLMPKLFARKWDEQARQWRGRAKKAPTPAKAVRRFNKLRSVSTDKKTGLVTVQIEWKDRVEAADWVNDLVRRLNAEMRQRAIRQSDASLGFLEQEMLTSQHVATRAALGRLIEVQAKQRMLANVTEEYVFRVVDPALPADADEPAWPRKGMMIVTGFVLGTVLGIMTVLFMSWWRAARIPD